LSSVPPSHRHEYQQRLHRVLAHIDAHLDQPLDLDSLAAVAHFSPFHFHRLFAALTGETLGDYLRRRRLEAAAQRLIAQPRLALLPLALSVGFGSAEAFTRAFKLRFGCTPSVWRAGEGRRRVDQVLGKIDQASSNPDQMLAALLAQHDGSSGPMTEQAMQVKLIDRKPVEIAYLRYTGPYGEGVANFWQQQVYPWLLRHQLLAAPRYGLSHDDPSITAPEKCRYDCAVEVPADFVPTEPALLATIPGGRYAAANFKGTAHVIADTWAAVLRDWLPDTGLQLDARPCFEYYPPGSSYDPATGVFDCEIVVPVAPLR
jgi:AraC family transcriptional regulator